MFFPVSPVSVYEVECFKKENNILSKHKYKSMSMNAFQSPKMDEISTTSMPRA